MKRVLLCMILALCAWPASAQVPVTPAPVIHQQFFSSSGVPLSGGRLFSYAAGTNTLQATYRDSTGSGTNTNPIILDSTGSANIWLAGLSYKFVMQDAQGNQLWSIDNVSDVAFINGLNAMLLTGDQTAAGNKTFIGNTTIKQLTLGTFDNFVYVDGVTYPTVQSAINALPPGGGTVFIPCGTYTLSSTLVLSGSLILQGCGIGNTTGGGTRLVAGSGAVTPLVQVQGISGTNRVGDVFIRDLTIQGVYTSTQICFQADHSTWIDLMHIQFVTCGQAEFIGDSFRASHYDVEYFQSGSGGTASTATVHVENVSSPGTGATEQTLFLNCIWEGDPGGKQGTSLYVGPNTSQTRVTNSKFDYTGTALNVPIIQLYKTTIVDISNNYISDLSGTTASGVIYINGDGGTRTSAVTIADNPIFYFTNAVPAVSLDYATNYNIVGNTFSGGGAGTGVVNTANTFGGSVTNNRMYSVDAMFTDTSGLAVNLSPDPSAAQFNLRSVLNTNKTITSTSTITTTGGLTDTSANGAALKKLKLNQGTAQTNGNVALSAGWGVGPTTAISGDDSNFVLTINTGTGVPTANPTVTVTFADGSWSGANPICFDQRADVLNPQVQNIFNSSFVNNIIFTFVGTPVAGTTYLISSLCFGR